MYVQTEPAACKYVKMTCWLYIYMRLGLLHIHATGLTGCICLNAACCLYRCKQGHAACACVKRDCCMYKCEFIYMQTRGCCVFMGKRVLMVLHM